MASLVRIHRKSKHKHFTSDTSSAVGSLIFSRWGQHLGVSRRLAGLSVSDCSCVGWNTHTLSVLHYCFHVLSFTTFFFNYQGYFLRNKTVPEQTDSKCGYGILCSWGKTKQWTKAVFQLTSINFSGSWWVVRRGLWAQALSVPGCARALTFQWVSLSRKAPRTQAVTGTSGFQSFQSSIPHISMQTGFC